VAAPAAKNRPQYFEKVDASIVPDVTIVVMPPGI